MLPRFGPKWYLWPLACLFFLGGGIYLLVAPGYDHALVTTGAILMIIVGSLLTAPLLVLLFLFWKLRQAAKALLNLGDLGEQAAHAILEQQRALYGGPHEIQQVSPSDFEDQDMDFYDQSEKTLERHGFRHIADIEDLTCSAQMPALRTFLRVMLHVDGNISAAIYHIPGVDIMPEGEVRAIEFSTEFDDGAFMDTSNLLEGDRTPPFDGIDKQRLPHDTPIDQVLQTHRTRLAAALDSGKRPLRISTYNEMIASQHRAQAIKSSQKLRDGFLNENDLKMISGADDLDESSQLLLDKVRELEARQRQNGNPRRNREPL